MYIKACRFDDDTVFYFDDRNNKSVARGGSVAWRLNNPGLLRTRVLPHCSGHLRIGSFHGLAIFPDARVGATALKIISLMKNLESFINDDTLSDVDPLTKMALIHHQFESIHPFYDGNGRTGRIISVLYLVKEGLLNAPVLYLSRYINHYKTDYYRLLQAVHDRDAWEDWLMYVLDATERTSRQTIRLIHGMRELMQHHKEKMRSELPRIYSQDLLNIIFNHPYTKIIMVERELKTSRVTATRYLNELARIGLMQKMKMGREIYYVNSELFKLLGQANDI